MVKVLGIDPGTKSFDFCGLEDGKVFYEKVVDTFKVAEKPEILVDAVEETMPLDLIVGPSGYGVKITYLKDIPLEKVEDWYLKNILLLKREDLENALKRKEPGIMVYSAMTKTAVTMRRKEWNVVYIPGVIHLPTVPKHRKFNRLDMGTADKMCIAVLGVYDQARRLNIPYQDVSFILVEMGFGYNAIIGVEKGRIVDGVGGTTGGMGFLTIGAMDAELVQLVGVWEKSDIFYGGVATVTGKMSLEEVLERLRENELYHAAWDCMVEGVVKNVKAMTVSVKKPREILVSGRLTRIKAVKDELLEKLGEIAEVKELGWVEGAKTVKEAAQGYAMVGDGLAGGRFKELIGWMKIGEAKDFILDYTYHPKIEDVKKLFVD